MAEKTIGRSNSMSDENTRADELEPDKKTSLKKTSKDSHTVRDYITMALILVLVYVVYSAVGLPMGLTIVGNLFMHAVCALLWGTLFLLLYTKVNKKWTPLKVGIVLALVQLLNFWPTSAFLAAGAVISEIIWQKMDRTKFTTMVLCFTTQISFWFLGIFAPMIVFANSLELLADQYIELYAQVRDFVSGPLFFIGLAAVIAGCVAGAFIGKLLLKKHFAKAGIA
jgi:energy-coupling factor transport system substrate-specific component